MHPNSVLELHLPPPVATPQWLHARAAGSIAIWDPIYGMYNSMTDRIHPPEEYLDAGWIEMPLPPGLEHTQFRVFLAEPLARPKNP